MQYILIVLARLMSEAIDAYVDECGHDAYVEAMAARDLGGFEFDAQKEREWVLSSYNHFIFNVIYYSKGGDVSTPFFLEPHWFKKV